MAVPGKQPGALALAMDERDSRHIYFVSRSGPVGTLVPGVGMHGRYSNLRNMPLESSRTKTDASPHSPIGSGGVRRE